MEPLKNTLPEGKVKLRLDLDSSFKPSSIPELIDNIAEKYPDHIALCYKEIDDNWHKVTYAEYRQLIHKCAKGFLKLGLERHHGVCILGFNSVEWFISLLAGIHAGGIVAGVYTTNSAEACQYCFHNSRSNIVVAEDAKQVEKVLQEKERLPFLKKIIQYNGSIVKDDLVMSWKDLLKLGDEESDEKLKEVIKTLSVNECCTLVYTSGTTGFPKGVMLSHDNLTYAAKIYKDTFKLNIMEEVVVSYLPLSHIAAQIVDIYTIITVAGTVYFADKSALKGTLADTLKEAHPTVFIGVPRVWEKIYEKMMQIGTQATGLKRCIANWAKSVGLAHSVSIIENSYNYLNSPSYFLANMVVFKKVKQALGFDRCKLFLTAGAPLDEEIKKYFMSLDIIIVEAYGMSECCGAHTINSTEWYRPESVGKPFKNLLLKIANPDDNGEGEICMNGRHIFMGYLNDEKNTDEALDEEGWLHSGDMGKVDSDGYLFITGRIKELIITAGGENVPPVRIENILKNELPVVSQCMLIGDKRKYLTILIALKTKTEPETGAPLDEFTSEVKMWLNELGCSLQTVPELLEAKNEKVNEAIQEAINRVNNQAISNAQKIQKFAILPIDFSVANGELGPTLKMKRKVIEKQYEQLINDLYKE